MEGNEMSTPDPNAEQQPAEQEITPERVYVKPRESPEAYFARRTEEIDIETGRVPRRPHPS